ncbi:unannotated protein [freshwater metagenome]|uniref:Unannotated protein n=1 Tax=freshwater metagenome TaxID=449393 RepID=A0A6J7G4I5_9ZZZZ
MVGDVHVIGRQDTHLSATIEGVSEMSLDNLQARSHDEADDQIDAIECWVDEAAKELNPEVAVLGAIEQLEVVYRCRPNIYEVVPATRHHMSDPTPRVRRVTVEPRDHV